MTATAQKGAGEWLKDALPPGYIAVVRYPDVDALSVRHHATCELRTSGAPGVAEYLASLQSRALTSLGRVPCAY